MTTSGRHNGQQTFVSRWTPRRQHCLHYTKSGIVRCTLRYFHLSVDADLAIFGLLYLYLMERCGVHSGLSSQVYAGERGIRRKLLTRRVAGIGWKLGQPMSKSTAVPTAIRFAAWRITLFVRTETCAPGMGNYCLPSMAQ